VCEQQQQQKQPLNGSLCPGGPVPEETFTRVCEQLVQISCLTAERPGIEVATVSSMPHRRDGGKENIMKEHFDF